MNPGTERKLPGLPLRVVLLLGAVVFINYVDRGNLATASLLLTDELGLSNSQIGILLAAFFWSTRRCNRLPAGSSSALTCVTCSPVGWQSGRSPPCSLALPRRLPRCLF